MNRFLHSITILVRGKDLLLDVASLDVVLTDQNDLFSRAKICL